MRHPLIAEYAYPISKGGLDAETLRRRAKFTVDGNYRWKIRGHTLVSHSSYPAEARQIFVGDGT
jgi:hypothetical protein